MKINSASDLVTSRKETRAGFIEFALEKNRRAKSFIDSAKAFKCIATEAKNPNDLINIKEIRESLLTADG